MKGARATVLAALAGLACDPPPDQPGTADGGVPFHDAGGSDGATSDGAAGDGAAPAGAFTVVVLPDTQYYAVAYPEIFNAQADWIVANRDALNIAFVVHEGDVVDSDVTAQWERAASSLHRLDGVVPYLVTAGNHDYRNGCRDTMIDTYFPVSGFAAYPWFGGTFEPGRIENNFALVPVGGGASWLVMELEFGPRDEVLTWADAVLALHPDVPAMIVTHAYLYNDGSRYDLTTRPDQYWSPHNYGLTGSVNDGEQMWQVLISQHDNVKFVLSGHALPPNPAADPDAKGHLTSARANGTTCHQILANYQTCSAPPCPETMGGDGYLRMMRFDPAVARVSVKTYSPYLQRFKTDDANQFELPLP
jgi:hypothetical protein